METNAPRPFEAALFDLDGTLVDTERVLYRAWTELVRRAGADFSTFDYAEIIGRPDFECAKIVSDRYGLGRDPVAWYAELDAIAHEMMDGGLTLMPGAADLLAYLECFGWDGLVAIVTSSTKAQAEFKLRLVGLHDRYPMITSDTPGLRARKPAPDPFYAACNLLWVEPSRCVVFEDSPAGIRGARAAGCFAIGIPHEFSPAATLAEADLILPSLAAFRPRLVPRLGA